MNIIKSKEEISESLNAPILIGGVGGSGTRIITEILIKMGYFMGSNLNHANDNLDIAEYFKHFRVVLTNKTSRETVTSRKELINLLNTIQNIAKESIYSKAENTKKWGWKVPANYILLGLFLRKFPNLKYIHTIRHGLDMVYSKNQNQLKNWGSYFQTNIEEHNPEVASLKFWINANKYAIETGKNLLGERFLLLNFDELCTNPLIEGDKIAKFLNTENDIQDILMNSIQKPDTLGRYMDNDMSIFSKNDLKKIVQFGFNLPF